MVAAAVLLAAGCGGSSKKSTSTSASGGGSNFTAALVSDIGKFNDRSFNQSQLEGLNQAKSKLGVKTIPLQSNSVSDYIPNLTTAVRRKADIVVSAGFLLANATATVAVAFASRKPAEMMRSAFRRTAVVRFGM